MVKIKKKLSEYIIIFMDVYKDKKIFYHFVEIITVNAI